MQPAPHCHPCLPCNPRLPVSYQPPGAGADPTFEADLALARLLVLVLSQGGAGRHRSLVQPGLAYLLSLWQRAGAPQAAAADADPSHVRAVALASMLSLLRYKWQALMGAARPAAAAAAAGVAGGSAAAAHPLAASLQAAAAAAQQQQQGQQGQGQQAQRQQGGGAALVEQVLALLLAFLGGGLSAVLAAADVRLVLEELYELQVGG